MFEVQHLGYPLANFQLLMISGLPCKCDNILVPFFVKNHLYLYQFCLYLIPRCALYPFQCMPNLKAIWLHICILWQFFASVQKKKRRKNPRKMSDFLKAYISGMASMISFRPGMRSLPICRHLHSKFDIVRSRDHGATNTCKIVLVLHVNILIMYAHALFSWAARYYIYHVSWSNIVVVSV